MKSVIVIFCTLLLLACDAHTKGWRAEQAIELCKDHGGVDKIGTILYSIVCNDGYITRAERPST